MKNKRILETGLGSVLRFEDNSGKQTGPYRVFDSYGISGGLAISRSIGDHALAKSGVIPDPEFVELEITENDKLLIIASDGVWEFLTNEDVLQLAYRSFGTLGNSPESKYQSNSIKNKQQKSDDPHSYTKKIWDNIIKISKYYWSEYEKSVRDDITLIAILLNSLD